MNNPHQRPIIRNIEIDDCGNALSQHPLVIGLYDNLNKNIKIFQIPEYYFSDSCKWSDGLYYYITLRLIKLFIQFNIRKCDSFIKLCRSVHFTVFKRWLSEQNYEWSNNEIKGVLQNKLSEYQKTIKIVK